MTKIFHPLLFGFFALLLTLGACSKKSNEKAIEITPGDLKKEVLKNVEILYSDSAQLRVKISGKVMIRTLIPENMKDEFTDGVLVDFYDAFGKKTSNLKADYALRYQDKDDILVSGNVVLTSEKNETMESDELIWNKKQERVYTEKFVMVKTTKERAWGQGFESNQNFTAWQIKGFEGKIRSDKIDSSQ